MAEVSQPSPDPDDQKRKSSADDSSPLDPRQYFSRPSDPQHPFTVPHSFFPGAKFPARLSVNNIGDLNRIVESHFTALDVRLPCSPQNLDPSMQIRTADNLAKVLELPRDEVLFLLKGAESVQDLCYGIAKVCVIRSVKREKANTPTLHTAQETLLPSGTRVGPFQVTKVLSRGITSVKYLATRFGKIDEEMYVLHLARKAPEITTDRKFYDTADQQILVPDGTHRSFFFESEFKKLLDLSRSNFCRRETYFYYQGLAVLATKYVEGRTLRSAISANVVNLSHFEKLALICRNICDQGLPGHGNLHPESVLVTSAKPSHADQSAANFDLTLLAPSVNIYTDLRNSHRSFSLRYNPFGYQGSQADIFAIGAMMYEWLHHELPYPVGPAPGFGKYVRYCDRQNQGESKEFLQMKSIHDADASILESASDYCLDEINDIMERCLLGSQHPFHLSTLKDAISTAHLHLNEDVE